MKLIHRTKQRSYLLAASNFAPPRGATVTDTATSETIKLYWTQAVWYGNGGCSKDDDEVTRAMEIEELDFTLDDAHDDAASRFDWHLYKIRDPPWHPDDDDNHHVRRYAVLREPSCTWGIHLGVLRHGLVLCDLAAFITSDRVKDDGMFLHFHVGLGLQSLCARNLDTEESMQEYRMEFMKKEKCMSETELIDFDDCELGELSANFARTDHRIEQDFQQMCIQEDELHAWLERFEADNDYNDKDVQARWLPKHYVATGNDSSASAGPYESRVTRDRLQRIPIAHKELCEKLSLSIACDNLPHSALRNVTVTNDDEQGESVSAVSKNHRQFAQPQVPLASSSATTSRQEPNKTQHVTIGRLAQPQLQLASSSAMTSGEEPIKKLHATIGRLLRDDGVMGNGPDIDDQPTAASTSDADLRAIIRKNAEDDGSRLSATINLPDEMPTLDIIAVADWKRRHRNGSVANHKAAVASDMPKDEDEALNAEVEQQPIEVQDRRGHGRNNILTQKVLQKDSVNCSLPVPMPGTFNHRTARDGRSTARAFAEVTTFLRTTQTCDNEKIYRFDVDERESAIEVTLCGGDIKSFEATSRGDEENQKSEPELKPAETLLRAATYCGALSINSPESMIGPCTAPTKGDTHDIGFTRGSLSRECNNMPDDRPPLTEHFSLCFSENTLAACEMSDDDDDDDVSEAIDFFKGMEKETVSELFLEELEREEKLYTDKLSLPKKSSMEKERLLTISSDERSVNITSELKFWRNYPQRIARDT
ncbi:hypothetical protein MPSEU_000934700 [Mayamaea pseudoterrestris]|nr:hypothetical protein MPSEU_000934700 [Mayamaea pseudoterrestris]